MNVSLLIAEDRSRCTRPMLTFCGSGSQLVVLSQQVDESRPEFHHRVSERLSRLRRRGERLDEVLVVPGRERDESALRGRAQMLRRVSAELGREPRVLVDPGACA